MSAITVRTNNGVTVLDVSGELCFGSSELDRFLFTLRTEIDGGADNVIVNLHRVVEVDEVWCSWICNWRDFFRKRPNGAAGCRIVLLDPTEHVQDELRRCRVDEILDIYFDEVLAVNSFRG